jgi:adenylosuccinate synthase
MPSRPPAILVVDLAFGDAGKGTVVDYLTRRHHATLNVRFNGGPQAGHNVVTPAAQHHTFSQFGAGTLAGARTLLSQFMLIEPYALLNEARHLEALGVRDPLEVLVIDERCPVITPAQQAANRIRELARGDARHGTCGVGVGETVADAIEHPELAIRARHLGDAGFLTRRLRQIVDLKREQLREQIAALAHVPAAAQPIQTLIEPTWIPTATELYAFIADRATRFDAQQVNRLLRESGTTIFEGAQGVLLDEHVGFHPHTTWSTTTFANADALLDAADIAADDSARLGVLRTYFTRHGPGPFVTEDASLRPVLPEPHNTAAGWQGEFRVGAFDCVAARYAIRSAGGVDGLAITHLDRLPLLPPKLCTAYRSPTGEQLTDLAPPPASALDARATFTNSLMNHSPVYDAAPSTDSPAWLARVADALRTPVALTSSGPTHRDKDPLTDLA